MGSFCEANDTIREALLGGNTEKKLGDNNVNVTFEVMSIVSGFHTR